MPLTADDGLAKLRAIRTEFSEFCVTAGRVSEADTRSKLIDKVLIDVLGWPEGSIRREEHNQSGYLDYVLRLHGRPFVVVEAKREGLAFQSPVGPRPATLKLDGTLVTDSEIRAAVNQVRTYCDEIGSRFAIATNGSCWIVFRAIREDMPWREGSARVFQSLEIIEEHFTQFWNLLSHESIAGGSLDVEFGSAIRFDRQLERVLARLFNADLPLQRNRLHAQLNPLIRHVFEDIGDQEELDVLQACYVHSSSLRIVSSDLNLVITDAMPRFLRHEGAEEARAGHDDAGRFERALIHALTDPSRGQLFLLLGGIGCGKTTFLKRYQRTVGRELLEKNALSFHIDFLKAPVDPVAMEMFVWEGILAQVRARHGSPYLESRDNLNRAYREHIEALRQTAPRGAKGEEIDRLIGQQLQLWQQNLADYVPRLLLLASSRYSRGVVLFIDNVDQLSPLYQAHVFLLAQRVTRSIGSMTIVAMREESYYSASVRKAFTAYSSRKFHIASPQFRRLIGSRIEFAIRWLETEGSQSSLAGFGTYGPTFDRAAIGDFLRIVEFSIFEQNRRISSLIESVCFGNMRLALEMFTMFLTSGATDVDKMLRIYRREGAYFVAYHEFVKSIMLGDRKYYKESESVILNVFDCGPEKNSSHFTALRILRYLVALRGQSHPEGQGYCELTQLLLAFEDIFDNREDVVRQLTRLVSKSLIETDARSTETVATATYVRVTASGIYYARQLYRSFAYLDLVLQDTPLNNSTLAHELTRSVREVDNLSGREDEKVRRMEVRFQRVASFISYLAAEEAAERNRWGLDGIASVLATSLMPELGERFGREQAWIERRVRENRERFAEEAALSVGDDGSTFDDLEQEPEDLDPTTGSGESSP
jgi:hypothetical protein